MTLPAWLQTAAPDVAVEIDRTRVGAARVGRRSGRPVVTAHAVEALPAGAVSPALATLNMPDVGAVGQAVSRVLQQLGGRPRKVALVVPDAVAKVSLIRLERVPENSVDLQDIVRWQVKKTAPFPIEQAVLSLTPGPIVAEGGQEFVVTIAREEVIRQYEQACAMAGVHAGLVDLATFSVLNGLSAAEPAPSGDWLLVNVTSSYVTLAVGRGPDLIFVRNRTEEAEGTLADLMHQTAMYYEDRLKGTGFSRVWLAGGAMLPGGAESIRRVEERTGVKVEAVDPGRTAALADRISLSPDLMDQLAPLVGVLVREMKAA